MSELFIGIARDAAGVVLSFVFIVGIGGLVDHLFWKRKRKQSLFEEVYKAKLATSEKLMEVCIETSSCLSNLFQKWFAAFGEAQSKKKSGKLSEDAAIRLRQANDELKDLVYRQMNLVGKANLYFSTSTIGQVVSVFSKARDIQENPYRITDGFDPGDLLERITRLNGSLRAELGLDQLSGPDQLRDILYSRNKIPDEKYKEAISHLLIKNTADVVKAIDLYVNRGELPENEITETVRETISLMLDFEKDFGRELTIAAAEDMKKGITSATLKSNLHKK